ncbi:hypothetical protein [Azospirillum argentinense]|uniref:hypothetical protein n=1 Tax=Azospirillum argentinense TaxID=2970906 RepID=UPI0032DEDA7D
MTTRLAPLIASTLLLALSTACSKTPPAVTLAPNLETPHPAPPAGLTIADETWTVTAGEGGALFCLEGAAVERHLKSRADLARWMLEMNNLLAYYRGRSGPAPGPALYNQTDKTEHLEE